jgi:hypothetical protein
MKRKPHQLNHVETDSSDSLLETQTATSHVNQSPNTTQPQLAAFHGVADACPVAHRLAVGESNAQQAARAKARSEYMRNGEARLAERIARWVASGERVQFLLSSHIERSLPYWILSNPSTLHTTWYRVHYKAATVALRQVQAVAHLNGLTHIERRADFVALHCSWYRPFCVFSYWLFPKANYPVAQDES